MIEYADRIGLSTSKETLDVPPGSILLLQRSVLKPLVLYHLLRTTQDIINLKQLCAKFIGEG